MSHLYRIARIDQKIKQLHTEAHETTFACYLRRGNVPARLIEIADATSSFKSFIFYSQKYNPDQARVPAGSPNGGQWTSGGDDGDSDDDIDNLFDIIDTTGELFDVITQDGLGDEPDQSDEDIDNPTQITQLEDLPTENEELPSEQAPSTDGPKPSPNFKSPTNPPQMPPDSIPEGWRVREMPPTEQYPMAIGD